MSIHADWKAKKAKAKTYNNAKEIKFKSGEGLGKALDAMEAAEKVRKKQTTPGPEWAQAVDAWVASAKPVNKLGVAYISELENMPINDQAKKELDGLLAYSVRGEACKVLKEGQRLETMLKKHRPK